MNGDPLDLTGSWTGMFNYPRAMPPGSFTAELREQGGVVIGETEERSDSPADRGATLHALIEGNRSGLGIVFVKHYDAARRLDTPVNYSGTLSPNGDEITGTWNIAGNWSGTFLMVRRARRGAAIERRIAETVR